MGSLFNRGTSGLVLNQIASSQRRLHGCPVGEGILIDGEVRGVMGRLRSTSFIVHAHKVVVRGGDRLGIEGEVLAAHQRLPVPHILRANHLTGHLHEEIMELRAVDCWGERRAVFLEKVHGSTAPLYRCLRYNNLGQEK
jgi:hypothetical protein